MIRSPGWMQLSRIISRRPARVPVRPPWPSPAPSAARKWCLLIARGGGCCAQRWRSPSARGPAAHAAARLFVRLLGRFAGGLALTFKALGGVYITGGVASRLGPLLDEPQFRAAFEAHPPYATLLKTIPTLLITCEQPGLIGCAAVPR